MIWIDNNFLYRNLIQNTEFPTEKLHKVSNFKYKSYNFKFGCSNVKINVLKFNKFYRCHILMSLKFNHFTFMSNYSNQNS